MAFKQFEIKTLPKPPKFRKLIGPSFILLGLGLGSGELILWPYLSSNYGMGIIWGAILGITFQFFMNMEIERYALVRGESVFVGFARKARAIPFWFLISSFFPWIWPGIAAASAVLFSSVLGFSDHKIAGVVLLILMGAILSLGPILYRTVEGFEKILIAVGVPVIFAFSVVLARENVWTDAVKGIVGLGEGYLLFPEGIAIATFLAALAYSGAGGNLNLAQSFYIKEKGYGMGKYAGRITSLLTGKAENISLTGSRFNITSESLFDFKHWWRLINLEHFLVFWLTGSVTIIMLAALSYSTTFGLSGTQQGINFVVFEGAVIGERLFPAAGIFFMLIGGLLLFGTQMTVYDATSRILSENSILAFHSKISSQKLRHFYYLFLWLQIISGIVIFLLGFTEPLQLLVIAAVLNAFAMFVHIGLTLFLNMTSLEKELKPSYFRIIAMVTAFIFFGVFSAVVVWDRIVKNFL